MVEIGYRARHLVDPSQAANLVRAAASVLGGPDFETALAIIAPTVVLADLVRVDDKPDDSADLVYRIVEPLKNAPKQGTEIRLGLRGPQPNAFPPPPQPGEGEMRTQERVVLYLSAAHLRLLAEVPNPPHTGPYTRLSTPPVEGERVHPGYHSPAPETTLTRLRGAVRVQVCAPAYLPVGSIGAAPHSC
jgi:hypothetical protein